MHPRETGRIVVAVVLLAIAVIGYVIWSSSNKIDSFEKCKAAGYPILESYPEQCRTPDGKSFTRGFAVGDVVNYIGTLVCLPHKNTSGPVTLECAYGLQTNDGNFHALQDENQLVFEMNINDSIQVAGTIVKDTSEIYNIVDTVAVTSITKL